MLGDDALVFSHRLSRVVQPRARPRGGHRAGQHRARPARPGPAAAGPRGRGRPGVVPALPEGSPVPAEDALAFFRDDRAFRNVRLVEAGQRRLRGDRSPGCCCSRPARLALLQRLARQPRPGAGRDRGQGRQGAHLPPRLRRPLVPDARPGHRGVAAPAAWPGSTVVWPLHDELFRTHAGRAGRRRAAASGSTRRRWPTRSTWCSSRCSRSAASSGRTCRRSARSAGAPAATAGTPRRWARLLAEMQVGRARAPEGAVVTRAADRPRDGRRPRGRAPRSPTRRCRC